jgi:hypothetical protein
MTFTRSNGAHNASSSAVDIDRLISWATQVSGQISWATLVPGPGDRLVLPAMPPHPVLTVSMVRAYATLRAWLDRRRLTKADIDAVGNELASAWSHARMTGDYSFVGDVLRDLVVWTALGRMSAGEREAVRVALTERRTHALLRAALEEAFIPRAEPAAAQRPPERPQPAAQPKRDSGAAEVSPRGFLRTPADEILDWIIKNPVPPMGLR